MRRVAGRSCVEQQQAHVKHKVGEEHDTRGQRDSARVCDDDRGIRQCYSSRLPVRCVAQRITKDRESVSKGGKQRGRGNSRRASEGERRQLS